MCSLHEHIIVPGKVTPPPVSLSLSFYNLFWPTTSVCFPGLWSVRKWAIWGYWLSNLMFPRHHFLPAGKRGPVLHCNPSCVPSTNRHYIRLPLYHHHHHAARLLSSIFTIYPPTDNSQILSPWLCTMPQHTAQWCILGSPHLGSVHGKSAWDGG